MYGTLYGALFALCYVLTRRVKDPWVGPITSALVGGGIYTFLYSRSHLAYSIIGITFGLSFPLWRPAVRSSLQPISNLLNRLNATRQQQLDGDLQVELAARLLESCKNIISIGSVHRSLSINEWHDQADSLLLRFMSCSQDVDTALRQEDVVVRRVALRAVEDRLGSLFDGLNDKRRYDRYLRSRFQPIVVAWHTIVAEYVRDLTR